MKKSILLIAVSLFMLNIFTSDAQKYENCEEKQELGEQLRTYKETNVHPQMDEWKEQIDNALSSEDLETLNELRAEHREFRDNMQQNLMKHRGMMNGSGINCNGSGKGMQGKGKHGNGGQGKGMHSGGYCESPQNGQFSEQRQQFREARLEFRSKVQTIVENNQNFFSELFEEAEAKQETWKNEMKEIVENWESENNIDFDNMRGMKGHKRFLQNQPGSGFRANYKPQILLWDGTPPAPLMHGMNGNTIKSYNTPNPFSESTTINIEITKQGLYKIEILNSNGNIVTTLHDGELSEGSQSFTFDGSQQQPGVYFYKISGEGFEKTGKMILTK